MHASAATHGCKLAGAVRERASYLCGSGRAGDGEPPRGGGGNRTHLQGYRLSMRVSSPEAWHAARSVMLEYSLTCTSVDDASVFSYMRAGKEAQGRLGHQSSAYETR